MRIMQWNIGGGRIREQNSNPLDTLSYTTESMDYLAETIHKYSPDIITLQETHQSSDGTNQAQMLASMLGYNYWKNDTHDMSHIDISQVFGQAIISRFPINEHAFLRLPNPNLTVLSEGGVVIRSHDYGVSSAVVDMPDGKIRVITFHLPALHFFGITPESKEAQDILSAVGRGIEITTYPTIISGDYNLDTSRVLGLLPELNRKGFKETPFSTATTPKGRTLDHIVYFGFNNVSASVINTALTDHYPILAELERL